MLYTLHIHMQKHRQADSVVSDTNGFINFCLQFFDTKRERHNSYDANHTIWPHKRSLSVEICKTPTTCLNGRELNYLCPNRRELNCLPAWSNVNLQLTLFQKPQILRPITSGHDIIHTPAPFFCLGFIMTIVIVISFAYERKTAPNDYTLN